MYGILYLLVAKAIVIDPSAHFSRFGRLPILVPGSLSARSLTDWLEPAFVLYPADAVVVAPSMPAMFTVLVLGALVGVNGAMGIETLVRRPPACAPGTGAFWVASVLPSFLASFSCCAPTVLLLLGAGAAGAVISIVPFVVPAAAVLLLGSLAWSARSLERTGAIEAGKDRRRGGVAASVTRAVACSHMPDEPAARRSDLCEECGSGHSLRLCATCGHVGCCESQRGDAREHARAEGHPVIKSLPLGDRGFTWCYACNDYV